MAIYQIRQEKQEKKKNANRHKFIIYNYFNSCKCSKFKLFARN